MCHIIVLLPPSPSLPLSSTSLFSQAAAAPGGVIPDVVISCPSSEPPYPLISLCHCISRRIPVSCRLHVHSSASGEVSTKLMEFWKSLPGSNDPALRITVLWKSGESTPEFLLDSPPFPLPPPPILHVCTSFGGKALGMRCAPCGIIIQLFVNTCYHCSHQS